MLIIELQIKKGKHEMKKLSQMLALQATSLIGLQSQNNELIETGGYKNSNTKPTFYKKKQRAKVKAARKANLLMRKKK